ncbi:MAG: fatty acid cis/trans isomerase, partial [Gammaproteobacteria bacterium]|nr:fatty acid cis/trans isomerase [Gammaproteobacteria bacterium]
MPVIFLRNYRFNTAFLLIVIVALALSSCATKKESITVQQATIDLALLQTLPKEPISYEDSVKPILNNRCVVCHGCYDAPCQLKLSSPAGLLRGSSKAKVYNGARFKTMSPTRLGIDAKSAEEWRQKDFTAIINEAENDPAANLSQSVLYRMLRMKQITPQSRVGMLSDQVDISLNRKQTCPTLEEFDKYQHKFPLQGMPFAMPNLKDDEYTTLVQWLAQGAPVPADKKPSAAASKQIKVWETFLNGTDLKQKLVSRYLYEHLFQGHLHFKGTDNREFYRLVRSKTASGQQIDEIATVRPYSDPGRSFYYRLQRYQASIVAKDHVVYQLSDKRLSRFKELFIKPDYQVTQLPSWDPETASNPFKAYAVIPPLSRYQFLLDDARFFIEGFIKGPVCRGMIALNVIEDRFWVVFLDPKADQMLLAPDFLLEVSDYLKIPSSQEGSVRLLGTWKKYLKLEQEYVAKRFKFYEAMKQHDIKDAMNFLWDGDGENPNAALTIFRHFDSASVDYGFTGDYPDTAWVIDYPLLERIHYLLVAGFNVFGNLKHQLNTRLYMDFLRM